MRLVVTATLLASCGSPPSSPVFTMPTMLLPDAAVPEPAVVVSATEAECARACKVERACEGPVADAEISEPMTCASCATMDAAVVRCIAAATCDAVAACLPAFVWPFGDGDYWRDELR